MRNIQISDGLKLRFPGRKDEFCDGVEVGMLAALMTLATPNFTRLIDKSNVDQALALVRQMGYHIWETENAEDGKVALTIRNRAQAPKLQIVR